MKLDELMKLADLLDSKGEGGAADEIDAMIKAAGDMDGMYGEPTTDDPNEDYAMDPDVETDEGAEREREVAEPEAKEVMLKYTYDTVVSALSEAKNSLTEDEFEALVSDVQDAVFGMSRQDYAQDMSAEASLGASFGKLAEIADSLDGGGMGKAADMIDSFLQKYATEDEKAIEVVADNKSNKLSKRADEKDTRYDSEYHHSLQIREPKRDQEKVDREGREEHHLENQRSTSMSLSTRHCVDHIGTQMARVGPGSYQCPIDGALYNWETGFEAFDGDRYGGGSIAGQTAQSTGYNEIPHRIFDSRSNAINTIN